MNEKTKEIAKKYKEGKISALAVFKIIKDKKEDFGENHMSLIYYFDCEEKISYLLLKENFKKIAMDSLNDIDIENSSLFKMMSNIYMENVFNADQKFVSKAARDAYKEVLKKDFNRLEKKAIQLKKENLKRILDYYVKNNENIELTKKQMKAAAELSVYDKEIIKFLEEY